MFGKLENYLVLRYSFTKSHNFELIYVNQPLISQI